MQVSVETTNGLERKLKVGVPASTVDGEVNKRLQEIAKTQRLPGFRPGKIPMTVIRKRFGGTVRREVLGEVIQRSFFEAVAKEQLKPAGMPNIESVTDEAGKDIEFYALFEVFPEIELGNIEEISVTKPLVEITSDDVDNMMSTLQKQRQTWKPIDRTLNLDDKAVIDFEGKIDGEIFEGGSSKDFSLTLGSKSMIPGFEDGLVGKAIGETVSLNLTFPEDYSAEHLKGKDVVFDVTIKSAEEPVLPELDDEFAKAFGIEDGNLDGLREEVSKNMHRELEQNVKNNLKQQVIDGLIEKNEISVPKALIEQEVNVMRQQLLQQFSQGGTPSQMPELPSSMFEENATKRVKSGLLVSEVIKANNLKAEPEKVKEVIQSLASAYEDPEEVINYYYGNKQQMEQVEAVVLEDAVVDLIIEKGQCSEEKKSFDEVMNPSN